ncbi:MAG: hypothetical protein RLZZ440_2061, partial [Planctomycetota bacterium]
MRDGTSFDVRRGGCEAWGLVCVALVAWSHSAAGMPLVPDDQAVVRMYGGGVHAFFSGDYQQAYDDLTQSIEAGTDDPRAFYFRGLAARKLGRLDEAEADFATGSRRETENLGAWPVARSLERVQGPDRLALERYRREARVAAVQQQREAIERRYSGIQRRQPDLLRPQRPEGVAVDLSPEFL